MSDTTGYKKPEVKYTFSQLMYMADEAETIIDTVDESEYNVKYIAQAIVDHFRDTFEVKQGLTLDARIDLAAKSARQELADTKHVHASWQRHCAVNMAQRAISLAALINQRRMSRSKAIRQINQTIANRVREHEERKRRNERPSQGVELTEFTPLRGTKPSRKQQPFKRRSAHRKAA